jgi:hypothetical protein
MSDIREIVRPLQEADPAADLVENLNGLIRRDAAPHHGERNAEPIGKLRTGGATAGIARNVELYNLAFKLAWKYISEDQKRKQSNIARRLHDSIRRQLKEGATEAVFIASEALKDVERG